VAAEHLALTTQVAVKLIDPRARQARGRRERFRREATAAAQLRSAHVVQILDHGIDGVQPFIVMELLDGEDLFERLDKARPPDAPGDVEDRHAGGAGAEPRARGRASSTATSSPRTSSS
jgi:serine/threonine protein kinase